MSTPSPSIWRNSVECLMPPSNMRLHMFSSIQPNSPIASAPTKRPLPFKVWNMRLISVNSLLCSAGSSFQLACFSCMLASSSSNSSRKTSLISSSTSSPNSTTRSDSVGRSATGTVWSSATASDASSVSAVDVSSSDSLSAVVSSS